MKFYENESNISLLKNLIEKKREPHSIVICGESGLGKKTLAKYIASLLLCENGCDCGECRACRLIADNAHPDIITVEASATGNYTADSIREVTSDAYTLPSEGKYKIYLIPDLDRSVQTLTQIQNIMLKLIEEPPDSAVIILTARSKEIFLDTIISRTLILQAQEVSHASAQAFLSEKGIEQGLSEDAFLKCGGNLGGCLDYCENEQTRRLADCAGRLLEALANRDEYHFLCTLSAASLKKDEFMKLLAFMQRAVRDAARIKAKADTPFAFSAGLCRRLSDSFPARELVRVYDRLGEFSGKARGNCVISVLNNALAAALFGG